MTNSQGKSVLFPKALFAGWEERNLTRDIWDFGDQQRILHIIGGALGYPPDAHVHPACFPGKCWSHSMFVANIPPAMSDDAIPLPETLILPSKVDVTAV